MNKKRLRTEMRINIETYANSFRFKVSVNVDGLLCLKFPKHKISLTDVVTTNHSHIEMVVTCNKHTKTSHVVSYTFVECRMINS